VGGGRRGVKQRRREERRRKENGKRKKLSITSENVKSFKESCEEEPQLVR
jgi:hypothetical protein